MDKKVARKDAPMETHRRDRLAKWIGLYWEGKTKRFAEACDMTYPEVFNLLKKDGPRAFREKKARSVEQAAGMPEMWLDQDYAIEEPAALAITQEEQEILTLYRDQLPSRRKKWLETGRELAAESLADKAELNLSAKADKAERERERERESKNHASTAAKR